MSRSLSFRWNLGVCIVVMAAGFHSAAVAQAPEAAPSPQCNVNSDSITAAINRISADYAERFAQRRQSVEREAQQIRDDAPRPSAAGAAVGFDFEVNWREQKIGIDIPEFTMRETKIALDLPQVAMRRQEWIYHTPSVRMELRCIPGPPETVTRMQTECIGGGWSRICFDKPVIIVRPGRDICSHVPVPFMQEQRAVLDIPEVTGTARQEFVVSLPEVAMRRQDWILRLPEFTLRNVRVEARNAEDRSRLLAERERRVADESAAAMDRDISAATLSQTSVMFDCQEATLRQQTEAADRELELNIRATSEALRTATSMGAEQMRAGMQRALDSLLQARAFSDQSGSYPAAAK